MKNENLAENLRSSFTKKIWISVNGRAEVINLLKGKGLNIINKCCYQGYDEAAAMSEFISIIPTQYVCYSQLTMLIS